MYSLWCGVLRAGTVRMHSRSFSNEARRRTRVEEGKEIVDGIGINCARVGWGNHPILLLPGALGTIWTDFKPQLEHLSREKFDIVAWDPPGYGKSRPPDRAFSPDVFERDAYMAHSLMRTLGYNKFSLLGWSDGAITALILAAAYPRSVERLVALGGNAYVMPEELAVYESIRDIDRWSERMRTALLAIYGREYLQRSWSEWVDTMVRICDERNGDICREILPRITCPTLIVHGARDAMVNADHPTFLKDRIKHAKLEIFEKGSHNLHLKFHNEFNRLITNFFVAD